MISIKKDLCTSCGLCAQICETRDIKMTDTGAFPLGIDCSECGHCVAICPTNAVELPGYDSREILPYSKDLFSIDPDRLLNFMKFRRSTRRFLSIKPEREKIETILEAGRFSPTACNYQLLRYVVVEKELKALRDRLWEGAAVYARGAADEYLLSRYREYKDSNGVQDALLYDCTHLIFIMAPDENDACIASSRMELMANALGLGALYLGYCKLAVEASPGLQEYLGETEQSKTQVVLALGYPDVIWHRTVPRKPLQVEWK